MQHLGCILPAGAVGARRRAAPAALAAAGVTAEQAGQAYKGTMAYGILTAHNTSGSDRDLRIRFDAMASHDITFVGIIQTARASGLEKFPIPMC